MNSPLRVAVAVDSMTQPAWISRVVDYVREHHQLASVIVVPRKREPRLPLLARLFRRVDDAVFGRAPDGLTPCALTPPLQEVPADLVIAFADADETPPETWRIDVDGWAEFATRKPMTEAVLTSKGRVLARTTGMAEASSFRRAASRIGMRAAAMIEHELDRRARAGATPPVAVERRTASPAPSSLQTIRRALSSARAFATEKYRAKYTRKQWSVAFTFDPAARWDFQRFHSIIPPPDRIWADPFVIADGDRAWIFVEEMLFSDKHGFLSVLEARRDGTWAPPRPILNLPIHLSYPCVFRWNGELLMVPDTRFNQTVELYRCVEMPLKWELDTVLMTGVDAVDTTLFEANGRWWMVHATPSGDRAGLDRLWVYSAGTPRGPWTSHPMNPIECDVMGGRPGGRPVERDGKLLRPVQIGTPYYGHSLGLRELVTLTPERWEERLVETIAPDWSPGLAGTHTLNADGDVTVIDVLRVRRGG